MWSQETTMANCLLVLPVHCQDLSGKVLLTLSWYICIRRADWIDFDHLTFWLPTRVSLSLCSTRHWSSYDSKIGRTTLLGQILTVTETNNPLFWRWLFWCRVTEAWLKLAKKKGDSIFKDKHEAKGDQKWHRNSRTGTIVWLGSTGNLQLAEATLSGHLPISGNDSSVLLPNWPAFSAYLFFQIPLTLECIWLIRATQAPA